MNSHERAFVESFLYAPRRERFLEALTDRKKRRVFLDEFCHPSWSNFFVARYAARVDPAKDRPGLIAARLRKLGAPDQCYVIGERMDGWNLDLDKALNEVVGRSCGVVISCIPGKLAYLESENGRWILHKP